MVVESWWRVGGDKKCHRFRTSAKGEGRPIEARLSGNYETGAGGPPIEDVDVQ